MGFELGIACGTCDWYSAMGTASCPSCRSSLALGAGAVPEPLVLIDLTELKPRKPSGLAMPAVSGPPSTRSLQQADSAVSSSGAFDDKPSAHMRVAAGARASSEPS